MPPKDNRPDVVLHRPKRVDRLRDRVQRLRDSKAGSAAEVGLRAAASKTVDLMTSRKTAENVQTALAAVGQVAADATFRFDPHARLLFEFAQWGEDQHGRPVVVAATLQLAQDVIAAVANAGTSAIGSATIEQIQNMVRQWVAMVVTAGQAQSIEVDDVPAEYRAILEVRRPTRLTRPLSASTAIVLFDERPDPEAVAYVMATLPRFLQTYLMRSLVDALPDLLSQLDVLKR